MCRHPSSAALVLTLCFFSARSFSQEKAGWQATVEAFESKGARQLLPVHQILLGELEAETQKAAAGGDPKRLSSLDAALAVARKDHNQLQDGRVPHADPAEVEKEAFLRVANGTQWALVGTRNLKRIGVGGGALHNFSEDGRTDLGELSRQQVLPGVFANRRNEGGWTYYLLSPALDLGHCVVTTQMTEGSLIERPSSPSPQPWAKAPPPPPPMIPEAVPKQPKEELHVLLERKYRRQLGDHEQKLIRLLEDRLSAAADADRAAIEQRLLAARLALQLGTRNEKAPPAPPETTAAFHARLNGCAWKMPRLPAGYRVVVAHGQLQTLDAAGRPVESLATETLWPGVVRARAMDGSLLMAAFSPGLDRLVTFPVRNQFPARRVP